MIQRLLLALLCCVVLWQPTNARAQGDNVDAARAAEAAARDAYRKKDYELAAEGFGAAFRLDPKANTKYNEALALDKAGKPAAAADAYEAALTFGGLGDKLASAGTDALASLKTKLGRLVVKVPLGGSVTVAHAIQRGIPAKIHLSPGQHEVKALLADGSEQTKSITIVAGTEVELEFEGSAAPAVDQKPVAPSDTAVTPDDGDDNTGLFIAGWTMVGLGAAALIAMGVTGALTLSKVSKYDDTGNTDTELHDEATTLKTTTNVLVAAGGGLATIGVVLLIIGSVSADSSAGAVTPTPNGLRVRF
jgi:hypothetical protein